MLCPLGHPVFLSATSHMSRYFYCRQCEAGYVNMNGNMARGMYYPATRVRAEDQLDAAWLEWFRARCRMSA